MANNKPVPLSSTTPVPATTNSSIAAPEFDKNAIGGAATALASADVAFESAITGVAANVARILGTEPSYDLWTSVAAHFQTTYASARKCKPETAQKRWFAVAGAMEADFALEKPTKPTKSAEVKAAQREGAAAEAAKLIEAAKATTPAAILALSTAVEGIKAPVVAALAKAAGAVAADAAKDASEAARKHANEMREEIRKSLGALTNAQLEQVRALVASFKPATPVTPPAPAPVITDAAAQVGLESLQTQS
jgi:hypothetical protein